MVDQELQAELEQLIQSLLSDNYMDATLASSIVNYDEKYNSITGNALLSIPFVFRVQNSSLWSPYNERNIPKRDHIMVKIGGMKFYRVKKDNQHAGY